MDTRFAESIGMAIRADGIEAGVNRNRRNVLLFRSIFDCRTKFNQPRRSDEIPAAFFIARSSASKMRASPHCVTLKRI